MRFTPLPIQGAFLIEPEPLADARGLFARVWCEEEFGRHGIGHRPVQANVGWNPRRGTLRGMHYQTAPSLEAKLIRCTRGRVWDVLVDLRPDSPNFRQWHGEELSADNRRMLFIPPLCAHGYLTLADETELWYHASTAYDPASACGVRHDDPALAIRWPEAVSVISDRDRSWPLLEGIGQR
jgi:dTDP-4-dehydrorhamnose 3,5-epimerase